uniref:Uncharacterized protein n=1 Tax=Oryzias sinensis TaxID=183150 RepID=A0A8C7ZSJ6_9TELE
MFLDGGRKPEKTHAYRGRTCKLHIERFPVLFQFPLPGLELGDFMNLHLCGTAAEGLGAETEPVPGAETEPVPGAETEPVPGAETEPVPGAETEPVPGTRRRISSWNRLLRPKTNSLISTRTWSLKLHLLKAESKVSGSEPSQGFRTTHVQLYMNMSS